MPADHNGERWGLELIVDAVAMQPAVNDQVMGNEFENVSVSNSWKDNGRTVSPFVS
jgi:hypothetical protein